jgi:hypothetical protein
VRLCKGSTVGTSFVGAARMRPSLLMMCTPHRHHAGCPKASQATRSPSSSLR